jgi:hypothetical protein
VLYKCLIPVPVHRYNGIADAGVDALISPGIASDRRGNKSG